VDNFMIEKTLYDITDTRGVAANQTKQFDAAGNSSDGNNYMTPGTVTSSSTNAAVVREIHTVEIIPPQNSSGVYEDLREVSLVLDNHSVQHILTLPGQGDILMNPLRTQVWGGPVFTVPLGVPMWRILTDRQGNKPLRYTCPKFSRTVGVVVSSTYGVSSAANGGTGYRIILKGYEYTPAALQLMQAAWDGTVNLQTVRRRLDQKPALAFTYPTPGPLGLNTWNAYPGGPLQQNIKINPYWKYARNAQATSPNKPYVFTDFNALAGGTGHVEDTYQDLGFEFGQNQNAFVLRGFGVKGVPLPPGQTGAPGTPGANLARFGFMVNGNFEPEEEGQNNGIYATVGVNPAPFGSVSPYIALNNVLFRVPPLPGGLLIYQDNAAPFVVDNGSPIPAFQVAVAINGVLVERG